MDSEASYYSLFRPDIIPALSQHSFFIEAITYQYKNIASDYGADVGISVRRASEAFSYWQEDAKRTRDHGMPGETKALDSFKHASFIAFWLRRTIPVEAITSTWNQATDTPKDGFKKGIEFYKYGNEICALLIGYFICLNYRSGAWLSGKLKYPHSSSNGKTSITPMLQNRSWFLKTMSFPEPLLREYATIIKHKNVSPYAFYMMYKTIFDYK